jgi:hypothetical protein
MSDIVKFEWDQPVEVALKYPDPKMFESQWGGERAMYSLTDGRVMYVDSLGAARITSLGVQPGELFFVVKRKNGRLTDFVAFREGQEPPAKDNRWSAPAGPAKSAYKTPDLVASVAARNATNAPQIDRKNAANEPSDLERQLAQSIDMVERRKLEAKLNAHIDAPAVPAPAVNGKPTPPTKIPMDRAVVDAVRMVQAAMKETGEQWSDASKQDLVSTVLIAAQREGWVTMWRNVA